MMSYYYPTPPPSLLTWCPTSDADIMGTMALLSHDIHVTSHEISADRPHSTMLYYGACTQVTIGVSARIIIHSYRVTSMPPHAVEGYVMYAYVKK